MKKIIQGLLLGSALIATPAVAAQRDTPQQKLDKLLAGRVAGKPVGCIGLSSVQSSQIIDGEAIVYRSGSRLYVNRPRTGAKSLRSDDVLVTKTIGTQLCSIDTVTLLDGGSHFQRGFVVLDEFVPYSLPRRR